MQRRILGSRYWNQQMAWLGAKIASEVIAALCILGIVLVVALPLASARIDYSLQILFLQLMLGFLIALPALAMTCPVAAALSGVLLSRLNLFSRPWLTAVLLVIIVFPAVLLPLIQCVIWVWDLLSERGPRSLLSPSSYQQLSFLPPLILMLTALSGWRATSRALSIPMLDLPRWFRPVETGAKEP